MGFVIMSLASDRPGFVANVPSRSQYTRKLSDALTFDDHVIALRNVRAREVVISQHHAQLVEQDLNSERAIITPSKLRPSTRGING